MRVPIKTPMIIDTKVETGMPANPEGAGGAVECGASGEVVITGGGESSPQTLLIVWRLQP